MLPASARYTDFEVVSKPDLTYKVNFTDGRCIGCVDGVMAAIQAIYKIIRTERYRYPIYSWNYGISLNNLFGREKSYVIPEIERRITEAVMTDDRVSSVGEFDITATDEGVYHVTFAVTLLVNNASVKGTITEEVTL